MIRIILEVISWAAWAGTVLPSVLFLARSLSKTQTQWWMLAATVAWFVATPLWMGRRYGPLAPKSQAAMD